MQVDADGGTGKRSKILDDRSPRHESHLPFPSLSLDLVSPSHLAQVSQAYENGRQFSGAGLLVARSFYNKARSSHFSATAHA